MQCNRVFNRDNEASKARATGLQLDLSVTVRFAHPDATAVCTLSALLKTRNDLWQVSSQTLHKLMGSNNRVGIDAGVVASSN